MMKKNQTGMSGLVEMVMMMVAAGILAIVAYIQFADLRTQAKLSKLRSVGAEISSAVSSNYTNCHQPGSTASDVTSCDSVVANLVRSQTLDLVPYTLDDPGTVGTDETTVLTSSQYGIHSTPGFTPTNTPVQEGDALQCRLRDSDGNTYDFYILATVGCGSF